MKLTMQCERLFGLFLLLIWLGNIALTRLVLGSHGPSDVVAGTLLGSFWLRVLILALVKAEAVYKATSIFHSRAPAPLGKQAIPGRPLISE